MPTGISRGPSTRSSRTGAGACQASLTSMTRRSHLVALAGSLAAVAVVTLAIELFKSFVPS